MNFNTLARVFVLLFLLNGGCTKNNAKSFNASSPQGNGTGACNSAPAQRPLESCANSLNSLQSQAKASRLKSTELTAGQYSYSSGEIFIDRVLPTGERLRMHAKESLCVDPNTQQGFPRIELICHESVEKAKTTLEMKHYAPRLISISRDERKADVAFRGANVKTPGGTLSYQFEDSQPKMGMSRTDFQKNLAQSFDESYFLRESAETYVFIGMKKQTDGSVETIRMTLKKTADANPKDAPLREPVPDGIFKL